MTALFNIDFTGFFHKLFAMIAVGNSAKNESRFLRAEALRNDKI